MNRGVGGVKEEGKERGRERRVICRKRLGH